MNAAPRVSVITVVRNALATLPACIESVGRHTGSGKVDHWIQDGASTDGTAGYVAARAAGLAGWASEPDGGIYDAMNRAVPRTRGRWILFLGADDTLAGGFEAALPRLRDDRTVYYGNVLLRSSGRSYAGAFDARKLARTNICQQAIFYPRAAFPAGTPAFDVRYPFQADWAFNLRCWSDPALRFEYLPLTVAVFDDATGASSTRVDRAFNRDYGRLLRRHLPLAAIWRPLLVHALSRCYRALPGCAEPDIRRARRPPA